MKNRLFAIGDIHGCFNSFKELVEQKIGLTKNDKLVLLGDYIDRGTNSKEVIDYIIHLQQQKFDVVPLMGNHEIMLLDAFSDELFFQKWSRNIGMETLKSFGIDSLKDLTPTYFLFFSSLPYFFACDDFLFVHAGFNDEIDNPFEDNYPMLWSRNELYESPLLCSKTIIHGHTPITEALCLDRVVQRKNVLNIDTGCVYAQPGFGTLTAIELHSMTLCSV